MVFSLSLEKIRWLWVKNIGYPKHLRGKRKSVSKNPSPVGFSILIYFRDKSRLSHLSSLAPQTAEDPLKPDDASQVAKKTEMLKGMMQPDGVLWGRMDPLLHMALWALLGGLLGLGRGFLGSVLTYWVGWPSLVFQAFAAQWFTWAEKCIFSLFWLFRWRNNLTYDSVSTDDDSKSQTVVLLVNERNTFLWVIGLENHSNN